MSPACRSTRSGCCRRARRSARLAWRAIWPAVGTRLPNTRLREVRAALDATRRRARARARSPATTGRSATSWRSSRPSHSSSTRAAGRRTSTSPGRCRSSSPTPRSSCPAGDEPLVLVAASTERDPRPRADRRRARGARGRAGAGARDDQPARRAADAGPVPPNARVVDWLSYSQVLPRGRAGRLPRRPRHRRPGRSPPASRSSSARRPATWPRTAPASPGRAPG